MDATTVLSTTAMEVDTTAAEKRYWPQDPNFSYTKAEWREFVQTQNAGTTESFVDAETDRLWNMSKSRLCDQPMTSWKDILDFKKAGGIVAVISARRTYVTSLKPVLHKEGIVTTCGQPGDAMHGFRGQDPNSWVFPWIAKTIGSISALVHYEAHLNPTAKPKVKLVFCTAAMGTGSQSEWEQLQNLSDRIAQEVGEVDFSMDHAVVDPFEVLQSYGLDAAQLDAVYYQNWKKIYFVRHGQSQANVEGDMLNPPLTAVGQHQSCQLGLKKTFHVDTLVCSPHVRALGTLKQLSVTCNHAIISSTFAEMNRKEQQNHVPDLYSLPLWPGMRKFHLEVEIFAEEEALDNAELKSRVLKRLANIPGTEILVVSHRVLIRELTNEDVDNCSVVSCTLEQGSIENVKVEI